ncbi:hypothetical protein ACJIZ3_001282 [Penstemon smallii]|uniref:Uncharacterized protein n=1 Tax=Penstemon smallii TaxID=265156 RepID=A0ABD3U350_9LAMI
MKLAKFGSGLTTRVMHSLIDGSLLPIELEKSNCTEQPGGENRPDPKDLFTFVHNRHEKTVKKLTTIQFLFDCRH